MDIRRKYSFILYINMFYKKKPRMTKIFILTFPGTIQRSSVLIQHELKQKKNYTNNNPQVICTQCPNLPKDTKNVFHFILKELR
jgi:hypothetical protein